MDDPIAVLREALEREGGRIGWLDSAWPPFAALQQLEALVKACLNAQEGYELGSDPDVYAALQPFRREDPQG